MRDPLACIAPQLPPPPPLVDSSTPLVIGVLALQGAFAEHIESLCHVEVGRLVKPLAVRCLDDLVQCHALVLPGGESTAMYLIASRQAESLSRPPLDQQIYTMRNDKQCIARREDNPPLLQSRTTTLWECLKGWVREGRPTFGTCAGLILMSDEVVGGSQKKGGQEVLGAIKGLSVVRNQWGRQTESFECKLSVPELPHSNVDFHATFIRAPVVHTLPPQSVSPSPPVQVLARVPRDILPIDHATSNLGPDADVVALRQGNMLACTWHPEVSGDTRFIEYWLRHCVLASYGL